MELSNARLRHKSEVRMGAVCLMVLVVLMAIFASVTVLVVTYRAK